MSVKYYKRYRMEFDLQRSAIPTVRKPHDFEFLAWDEDLLESHAAVKCNSFSNELDSVVFPCLGDPVGCLQLMTEIAGRSGFLPAATWMAAYVGDDPTLPYYSATIQGLVTTDKVGSIQNVGTVPAQRSKGLAAALVVRALAGFQAAGLRRASLEVTVRNDRAVRLYERLGFRHVRTVYKAVEVAYS